MDPSLLAYTVAPLSNKEAGPYPTLILLHGRGTDENDLIGLTPSFDPRLLVVSVRAPFEFSFGGYTWFDLDEAGSINVDQLFHSRDALIGCMDDVQEKYPVDPKRIFLFGFSMGAMMSLILSLSNPNRFKGIIAHSGLLVQHEKLPYRWDDLSNLSFFVEHGTYDPVVPVEFGRQAYQHLVQAKADVVYREYPIQHAISDESLNDAAEWLRTRI
jgi:phospholipase/carboxylesterase